MERVKAFICCFISSTWIPDSELNNQTSKHNTGLLKSDAMGKLFCDGNGTWVWDSIIAEKKEKVKRTWMC